MLRLIYKPILLSVIMLNVVMLSVVYKLFKLYIVMRNVIMLNVTQAESHV